MDLVKVTDFLRTQGLPDYRRRQVIKNYFSGKYSSFDSMTDLPLALRRQLNSLGPLLSVTLDHLISSPKTQKARLSLSDGKKIETVLMDYGEWQTVCVSSQVGCPLNCSFCATGKMGFIRNLTPEEIIDQIVFWKNYIIQNSFNDKNSSPSFIKEGVGGRFRVVFMGMGEPFLNFDNLFAAIKEINSPDGLNIGQRKMSISTAGVVPGIERFTALDSQINLAISLHSADQSTREKMMPIARSFPLPDLIQAVTDYANQTRRQVFFEYLLAQGINDTPHHLQLLIDLISRHQLFYLNLIPLNPIKGGLTPSTPKTLKYFQAELSRHHLNFSFRQSLGQSAASACGQLIIDH